MPIYHAVLALLLLAAPTPAPAMDTAPAPAPDEGAWRAAGWGMSPEEVLAAFPKEAFRVSPEVKLADGKVVAVGIDAFPWEGLVFNVRFIFAGGKLALVSLRTRQSESVEAPAYVRLRDVLTDRWGAPREETRDDSVIDMRQARWNRGPDRADLKFIPGVVVLLHYPRPPG